MEIDMIRRILLLTSMAPLREWGHQHDFDMDFICIYWNV